MANWGDIIGSWQFIVDTVKFVTMLIQLNIIVLIAGVFTYITYQLFEVLGIPLVLGSRAIIVSTLNFQTKSLRGISLSEAELVREVRAIPSLSMMWDLRNYTIKAYRVWQYSIAFLMIGSFWIGLIFIFLGAIFSTATAGDETLLEYGMTILQNTDVMLIFALSVIALSTIITILMMAFRIWRYGVMDEKLIGDRSIWETLKTEIGPTIRK